ncbi:hypothetical protein BC830DRAFT_1089569 [Chytriomyces sp. MP71]|nr:hypothetical protein BC830DRAFT_1089569 [Chytriomyces sp. MP71]
MSWRESQSHSSSLPSREQAKQPEANIESKPPTHLMGPGGTELLDVVHGNSTVINAISPLDPQHGKEPLQQHLRSPPGVFPVHSNKSYDFSYQTSGNYQPEHHLEPPRHPGEYVPPFYPQYAINHPEEPAHYSEQEPWNLYAQATQVLEQPDTQPVTSSAGSSNPLEEHSRPQAFIQTEVDGRRRYNCTWEGCAKGKLPASFPRPREIV